MKTALHISFVALLALWATSCDKDPEPEEGNDPVNPETPATIIEPTEIQVGHMNVLGNDTYAVFKGSSFTFDYLLVPYKSTAQEIRWESSNTGVATVLNGTVTGVSRGIATITATVYNNGKKGVSASREVYVVGGKTEVDLGLSLVSRWAEFNLGEDAAGLNCKLVAWGELSHKTEYSQNNYKWYSNGSFSKYNANDTRLELLAEDDVVAQDMRGKWRMPTASQALELVNWCNTKKAFYYGSSNWSLGFLFISKKNNEFLFFSDYCYTPGAPETGDYHLSWTSTRAANVQYAYTIVVDRSTLQAKCVDAYYRYFMLPVRPVLNKN